MVYSQYCNWSEEYKNSDKWENNTYRILCEVLEDNKHEQFEKVAKRFGVYEENSKNKLNEYWEDNIAEDTTPIYNYIYPLEITPSDEDILRVSLNTNCCVLLNTENNTYYISLTGCGMDLSQDIALSYLWLEKWIPFDLIRNVSSQECLSISKENFKELKTAILEQAESYKGGMDRVKTEWLKD